MEVDPTIPNCKRKFVEEFSLLQHRARSDQVPVMMDWLDSIQFFSLLVICFCFLSGFSQALDLFFFCSSLYFVEHFFSINIFIQQRLAHPVSLKKTDECDILDVAILFYMCSIRGVKQSRHLVSSSSFLLSRGVRGALGGRGVPPWPSHHSVPRPTSSQVHLAGSSVDRSGLAPGMLVQGIVNVCENEHDLFSKK